MKLRDREGLFLLRMLVVHFSAIIMLFVTDSDIREQVKSAGAELFLSKPFQLDRLFDIVGKLLKDTNDIVETPIHMYR